MNKRYNITTQELNEALGNRRPRKNIPQHFAKLDRVLEELDNDYTNHVNQTKQELAGWKIANKGIRKANRTEKPERILKHDFIISPFVGLIPEHERVYKALTNYKQRITRITRNERRQKARNAPKKEFSLRSKLTLDATLRVVIKYMNENGIVTLDQDDLDRLATSTLTEFQSHKAITNGTTTMMTGAIHYLIRDSDGANIERIFSKNRRLIINQENKMESIKNFIEMLFLNYQFGEQSEYHDANGSGSTLIGIIGFDFRFTLFDPARGRSFFELPEKIFTKNKYINPKNSDNLCLLWCIYIQMLRKKYIGSDMKSYDSTKFWGSTQKYRNKFYEEFVPSIQNAIDNDLIDEESPQDIIYNNLAKIEEHLNVSIYIWKMSYSHDENNNAKSDRISIYRTSKLQREQIIDLLHVYNNEWEHDFDAKPNPNKFESIDSHYIILTNVLRMRELTGYKQTTNKVMLCRKCMKVINSTVNHEKKLVASTEENYIKHLKSCEGAYLKPLESQKVYDEKQGTGKKFTNFKSLRTHPYVIYADFESAQSENKKEKNTNSITYNKLQKPYQCVATLSCMDNEPWLEEQLKINKIEKIKIFNNDSSSNLVNDFIAYTVHLYYVIKTKINPNAPFIYLPNNIDREQYERDDCIYCFKRFKTDECQFRTAGERKLRHLEHNHLTGEIIGYACHKCNAQLKWDKKLYTLFHNGSGYDFKLILKYINHEKLLEKIKEYGQESYNFVSEYIKKKGSIINDAFNKTSEKLMQFSIFKNIIFRDSVLHVLSSLNDLVNFTIKGKTIEQLRILFRKLIEYSETKGIDVQNDEVFMKILTSKGRFPYKFVTKDNTKILPRLEAAKTLPVVHYFDIQHNDLIPKTKWELHFSKCLNKPKDISMFKHKTLEELQKHLNNPEDKYLNSENLSLFEKWKKNDIYNNVIDEWKLSKSNNLLDYSTFYCVKDTLLLEACFNEYRKGLFNHPYFKLDPIHFLTLSSFSQNTLLKNFLKDKYINEKDKDKYDMHELAYIGSMRKTIYSIPEEETYLFAKSGIRGGCASVLQKRKFTIEESPNQECLQLDVNSQYPSTFLKPIPLFPLPQDNKEKRFLRTIDEELYGREEEEHEYFKELLFSDDGMYQMKVDLRCPTNIQETIDYLENNGYPNKRITHLKELKVIIDEDFQGNLHNYLSILPPFIHHKQTNFDELCEYNVDYLRNHYSEIKNIDAKEVTLDQARSQLPKNTKLIYSFENLKDYVAYNNYIRFLVCELGCIPTKFTSFVKYYTSPVLKCFAETIYGLRNEYKAQSNELMQFVCKIVLNSLYGKMLENCEKRNVHRVFCTSTKSAINYFSKDYYKDHAVINDSLILVMLNKKKVIMNNTPQVGSFILDNAKLALFKPVYEIRKVLKDKVTSYYSDTDSIFLSWTKGSLSDILDSPEIREHLDMSSFKGTSLTLRDGHSWNDERFNENKKVLGKLAMETDENIYSELVCIAAKQYSKVSLPFEYQKDDLKIENNNIRFKLKGVTMKGADIITPNGKINTQKDKKEIFNQYNKALSDTSISLKAEFDGMRSKNLTIFNITNTKMALSGYNDKNLINSNGIDCKFYGQQC